MGKSRTLEVRFLPGKKMREAMRWFPRAERMRRFMACGRARRTWLAAEPWAAALQALGVTADEIERWPYRQWKEIAERAGVPVPSWQCRKMLVEMMKSELDPR